MADEKMYYVGSAPVEGVGQEVRYDQRSNTRCSANLALQSLVLFCF